MHRSLPGANTLETLVATALFIIVTIVASPLSIADQLPAPFVRENARSVASAADNRGAIPSQPTLWDDEQVRAVQDSDPSSIVVYQPERSGDLENYSSSDSKDFEDFDRAYLVETATSGWTMTRQGPELAIGRLHPEFVHRLAEAIREARQAGLSYAGVFSAYRPPAFGIGGFSGKVNSLHTYGLAVDMSGHCGPGEV